MNQLFAEVTESDNSKRGSRKIIKTTKVVCTQCNKLLGSMLESDPKLANNTEIAHIFVCPCGGESFLTKVRYAAFFLSEPHLVTTSITECGNNKFKSVLENHDGE